MGCGALFGTQWFQYQCPEGMDKANITRRELIPIILAVAIWGHEWSRKTVVAQCDNLAVVDALNRGYGREPDIMHLMRCLFFFSALFHFRLIAKHIPGKQNILDPKIPNMTKLALVLREIRSTQSKNRGTERIWLPITPPILRKIRAV